MIQLRKSLLVLFLSLGLAHPALAQNYGNQALTRNNPKFVQAFRTVVAKPSESTVRVLCDDKETALGVIVGPDGWILTKAYDLKGKIAVKLKDGSEQPAQIVGVHKEHDLAMLKIDARDLKAIEFKDSKSAAVGDWVASVGTGADPVAFGVISVGTRKVPNKGPAFTIDALKAGYLGVALEQVEAGVRVTQVMPNTAAAKAGLKVEDIVLMLSGKKIREVEAFIQAIGKKKPGEVVTIKVRRGDEELELKAALGKRPENMARGDIQNRMGSELSSRRTGYETILQHDSVVKPVDCGGPIVDLDGKVLGINICRAGRTETWAVPTEVIRELLPDLMSGKLAPPEVKVDPEDSPEDQLSAAEELFRRAAQEKARLDKERARLERQLAEALAALDRVKSQRNDLRADLPRTDVTASAADHLDVVNTLLSLMRRRLELMEEVAIYKWVNKLPVSDPERERQLLDGLLQRAANQKIDPDLVRAFFQAQFAAARAYQEERMRKWNAPDRSMSFLRVPDLQSDIRPRIDQLSNDLLAALARIQPHLNKGDVQKALRDRALQVLASELISDIIRAKALEWVK